MLAMIVNVVIESKDSMVVMLLSVVVPYFSTPSSCEKLKQ